MVSGNMLARCTFAFPSLGLTITEPYLQRQTHGLMNQCLLFLHNQNGDKLSRFFSKSTNYLDSREMEIMPDLHKSLLKEKPDQPDNPKCLKVAIVGCPNAGKSTLANKIMGRKFSVVSSKVHTTRSKTLGVLTENDTQILFLDTPGMISKHVRKRFDMEVPLLTDPHSSLFECDIIMVVSDVSTGIGRNALDKEVLKALILHSDKPSILVLNKTDLLRVKSKLLHITRILTDGVVGGHEHNISLPQRNRWKSVQKARSSVDSSKVYQESNTTEPKTSYIDLGHFPSNDTHKSKEQSNTLVTDELPKLPYVKELSDDKWRTYESKLDALNSLAAEKRGWDKFHQVFMVSAKYGEGVSEIKDYLLGAARHNKWLYNERVITNQDPMQLAKMCVWEKAMDHLPNEVPYQINVNLTLWEVDDGGMLHTVFEIVCDRKRQLYKALGPGGETTRKIAIEAKQELMNMFYRELSLKLIVRLKHDISNS